MGAVASGAVQGAAWKGGARVSVGGQRRHLNSGEDPGGGGSTTTVSTGSPQSTVYPCFGGPARTGCAPAEERLELRRRRAARAGRGSGRRERVGAAGSREMEGSERGSKARPLENWSGYTKGARHLALPRSVSEVPCAGPLSYC